MMLENKMLIVLAVASLGFAVGCSSEEQCSGDDCIDTPGDPGEPLADDSPSPGDCRDQCAHLQDCSVISDLECVAMCNNSGFSAQELTCVGGSPCGAVDRCLDIDISDPVGG